jgi:hypothetical protein
MNATPTASDAGTDLERGEAAFRDALAIDPAFEDARGGLYGCLAARAYVLAPDDPRRKDLFTEIVTLGRALEALPEADPRTLWLVGGSYLFAPPPHHDEAKAEALYRRGLEGARREATGPAPAPWEPRWGAPELLMSLAFLHSRGSGADRELARAYALGALAMAPDWSYVATILLPRIEALPARGTQPEVGAGDGAADAARAPVARDVDLAHPRSSSG